MQAPASRSSRPSILRTLTLAVLVGCALGACDKHSAQEVPESYGHGSAHDKSYKDHRVDSSGPDHYSDTQGTDTDTAAEKPADKPAASPAGTPGGHFF